MVVIRNYLKMVRRGAGLDGDLVENTVFFVTLVSAFVLAVLYYIIVAGWIWIMFESQLCQYTVSGIAHSCRHTDIAVLAGVVLWLFVCGATTIICVDWFSRLSKEDKGGEV